MSRKPNYLAAGFRLLAFVAALVATNRAAAAETRFVQDRFAVGFWDDPPADQQTDTRFAEIAEANFTFIIGGFGATTPKAAEREIQLCDRHGLKAIVSMAGLPPDKLPDKPACWGYVLADEPAPGVFPDLSKTVEAIHQRRPGKLAFINLLPNYAPAWALGTTSYAEHVARFIKVVKPDVLSMDHYPMFKPDSDGRAGYCDNLEVMRSNPWRRAFRFGTFSTPCRTARTPIRPRPNSAGRFTPRWPTAPKASCTSVIGPRSATSSPKAARLSAGTEPARAITRKPGDINAALKNLGPTLMKLTSTAVFRVRPADPPSALRGCPIRSLSPGDYLVGVFRHQDGRRAVLLVNYQFAYSAWPTVEFASDPHNIREVSPKTGKELPVRDDSPDMPGLQISLDAGEGRLFLLPPLPK